jgi:hypothetical protein
MNTLEAVANAAKNVAMTCDHILWGYADPEMLEPDLETLEEAIRAYRSGDRGAHRDAKGRVTIAQEGQCRWKVDISDMQLHVILNDQPLEVSRVGVRQTSPHTRILTIEIEVRDGSPQHTLEVRDQGKTPDYDIDVVAHPRGGISEMELTDRSGDAPGG